MFRDAHDIDPGTRLGADVCVVGGGPAGITVARDLRGRGLRVILLESGGFESEDVSDRLNEGAAVGMPEARLTRCRARMLGGATSKWAGWCRPLDPEDFEARAWLPLSGWPVSRMDLEPYYRLAQRTCQVGALDYDAEAIAVRLGYRTLDFDPTRANTIAYQYSPPTRFGEVYRDDLERATDIEVVLHGNLVDIVLAEGGAAVARLRCATLDGPDFTVEAHRYVLAAGGIENARMLLASNRQESRGVGNRSGDVGRYFMEHPHFYAGAYVLADDPNPLELYLGRHKALTFDEIDAGGRPATVAAALSLPATRRAREGLQGLAATLRKEESDRTFDGPLASREVAGLFGPAGVSGGDATLYRLDIRCEQRPNPDSRVTLDNDRDALGLQRVRVTWDLAPEDFESVGRTLEILAAELGRLGLGRVWIPEGGDGEYVPPRIGAGCHHMGTTRMSENPADGVVDADCKVHGIANLFVLGSSVFPTGGFSNPTLTIVALAHRLAVYLGKLA